MWYYINDGNQHGPLDSEEIKSLIKQGIIEPITLVWKPGMDSWIVAKETELQNHFSHSPPPLINPPPIPNKLDKPSSQKQSKWRTQAIYRAKCRCWVHIILWFLPFGAIISCAKAHYWLSSEFGDTDYGPFWCYVGSIVFWIIGTTSDLSYLVIFSISCQICGISQICNSIIEARKALGIKYPMEADRLLYTRYK